MSTNARVYVEIKGKFAHLFFDQPAARNAMTQEMYEQLRTICLELNQNFQIRAVILRGIGGKSTNDCGQAQLVSYVSIFAVYLLLRRWQHDLC